MIKFMSGVVVGVFMGAMVTEVIQRHPELTTTIRRKARRIGERVREAAAQVEDSIREIAARDTRDSH